MNLFEKDELMSIFPPPVHVFIAANPFASERYLKFGFVETEQYETDHGVRKICLLLNRNEN